MHRPLPKHPSHQNVAFLTFSFVVTLPECSTNTNCDQTNLRLSPIVLESTATKQAVMPLVMDIVSIQQRGKVGTATVAIYDAFDDAIIKFLLKCVHDQVLHVTTRIITTGKADRKMRCVFLCLTIGLILFDCISNDFASNLPSCSALENSFYLLFELYCLWW